MIFKNQSIYLPGYQMENKTFGFSHGDYEPMNLPVGESVFILATSKIGEEFFYSLEESIIQEKSKVKLSMKACSKEEFKEVIGSSI